MTDAHWPLTWITEAKLTEICCELLEEAKPKSQDLDYRNIVDPFSALFDMTVNQMDYDSWIRSEIRRQQQKSLQNAIGKFHQKVLGAVEGWEDLAVGEIIDLKNDERKIIAEVKNKYNTVKGSDQIGIYEALANWRGVSTEHRAYTAYYVQILAKKAPFDRPFTPSDHTKAGERPAPSEKIREIDGRSFYELVTGSKTAIDDLYDVLPGVLSKASRGELDEQKIRKHCMFKDLFNKACITTSLKSRK